MRGKLLFRCGPMNSGKSLQLLATAYNFQDSGVPFIILKPSIDNRDGDSIIHSRAMKEDRECITVDTNTNIFELIDNMIAWGILYSYKRLQWILVDESQFLTPKQVDELAAVADIFGINIICYGLRSDFQTHLFPGSKRLFEIADSIEEIKSSCACGHKAIFNARVNENGEVVTEGEQVEIGGNDRYVAMCRKCYHEKIGTKLYNKKQEN